MAPGRCRGLALAGALSILAAASARAQAIDPNELEKQIESGQTGTEQNLKTADALEKTIQRLAAPAVAEAEAHARAVSKSAPSRPSPAPWLRWLPLYVGGGAALYFLYLIARRKTAPRPVEAEPQAGFLSHTNFAIVRVLGEGGMGVVYEAVDRSLDRRVAIKKMRSHAAGGTAGEAQFLREAKTVAALHHPNIVDIHSVVSQAGEVYLVFEYVAGKTVAQLIEERRRLGLAEVKAVLGPVCLALEFAHSRGVIHRDLKPANIMISEQGVVKVMDFGISRQVGAPPQAAALAGAPAPARADFTQTVIGTLPYMSPEMHYGVLRREADVYALGVTAYEMLSGVRPFPDKATPDEKTERRYAKPSSLVQGLGAGVDSLIDASLEPDPDKRLRTSAEFWKGLAAIP
ncbi:MAG: serine/threonine-protein kinase [Elusimicrobiota bacterium]|jgi:serine/threonine protein kinase